ncbi:unnamed protein product [Symbiodinium natans]|uniref:EF-hand domain-containing protein n=1 Tax=Symbiodinium natans TaxID=878477 RepID=A0A812GPI7_9DINO|nr:unnamed protein product [Symbiodinium natans]
MRDQIDVHHWTLQEGSVAVPYDLQIRKGLAPMDHFLDYYVPYTDSMFRDMRLPHSLGEAPIWDSLEKKGFIDNHRPSAEYRWGISRRPVDVWDLVRRDLLLDIREGYIVAARLLYDKSFADPTEEEPNDILMFCYLLQYLFDVSIEAINGFARVMQKLCPPFQKGELFPPLSAVHAGAVCAGLIDRASRLARGKDTQLAFEAAEFNEVVMQRLEEKFFLSPKIFEAMDQDNSGELSISEFVEGMRNIDMYKEFRHERVPEDVLRMIVADLAQRLFQEVDVNGDGTLTVEEIGVAIRRRRTEALRRQQKRQWFRKQISSIQQTVGMQKEGGSKAHENAVKEAKQEEVQARAREMKRSLEWQAEVEKIHLPDASVDLDVGVSVTLG